MKKMPWGLSLAFFLFISVIMVTGISIEKGNKIEQIQLDEDHLDKKEYEYEYEQEQWNNVIDNIKLTDNKELYDQDKDSHVDKIYMTVLPPKNKKSVTFEEVNRVNKNIEIDYTADAFDKVAEIIFQTDKANNEKSTHKANATIELRGQSARLFPQKSYKIKLFNDTENWIDFHTINLNKHYEDPMRIKNKLSYDYFEMLDDFVSLRTRFVRVYIKDLSSGKSAEKFEDYGLYTFIEQPNKSFLKRHNLDKNANLYKVENFEFYRYADHIKTKDDTTYDIHKFEEILEISGNDNHKNLIEMLDAVNDYGKNINEVVDKYFDRDNLMTWLAVNILFDNYDTNSRNFLLYSSLNSNKWFFIPWDYDKAWTYNIHRGKWEKGLSNYWTMVLFNRLFKDPDNITELSKKIEELASIINEDNTRKFLDEYYKVVEENVLVSPDINYLENQLETTLSEYKDDYYSLVNLTEKNRKYYYEGLKNPMPFYLEEPIYENGKYTFSWQAAYDIDGNEIEYKFLISSDQQFENIVAEFENLKQTSCNVENLGNGDYYWKVIAYDSKENWQEAFDNYVDEILITGTKKLTVNEK